MTNSIPEIRDTDFLFVTGSNTTEAHPIIAMEMKRAIRRGAKLAVSDPRAIPLTEWADWHMSLEAGHRRLAAERHGTRHRHRGADGRRLHREELRELGRGARDRAALPARGGREGHRAFRRRPSARWRGRTRRAEKAGIYYTLGITEHTTGTDNVYAFRTWC